MAKTLRKMDVSYDTPVGYNLSATNGDFHLNEYIGKQISISFDGVIECVACSRSIKKTFQGGYCYVCFTSLAQCDSCIMKPELCHFHKGTCRQPEWGESHCMQPHIIYLANTTELKVGITREINIPTRWIDQGAIAALPIIRVKKRYHAGLIEVALGEYISDKTNWRKLITGDVQEIDLIAARDELLPKITNKLGELVEAFGDDCYEVLLDESVRTFDYPVEGYLPKAKTQNLDKTPQITGKLLGIRGQYLLLDTGAINIRKFGGYAVTFSAD